MEPRYEESSGHLIIEWMESIKGESPKHHYYNKKPLKLQFHPKEKDRLVRGYFSGALPGWMKRYADLHKFEVQQVNHEGKSGWWLSKWGGFDENPFSAPTIKGAVRQFCKQIPFVCDDLVEKVKDNLNVIERNLFIDPSAFEQCGLYFSKEIVEQKQGCLLLEEGVIPNRETDESDEDYRNRIEATGKLAELVWEITTPLPEPEVDTEELVTEMELEEIEDIIEEDAGVIDLDIELEMEEEMISINPIEEEKEELLIQNEDGDFFEEPIVLLEEETVEQMFELPEDSGEVEEINEELNDQTSLEEELLTEEMEENEIQEEEIIDEQQDDKSIFSEPIVIEQDEKKSKALAGQMMLF
ncbi:hypothetical protein [Bacillus sp. FJAT-29937]|uniref:hypothetical protein n=1 Tax=Bacillus sp. FJAT-29937 TaxID=1720553 RepID=UPI00082F0564|nr:hypothetical protein [Bacillus sp. FJAT-29937]